MQSSLKLLTQMIQSDIFCTDFTKSSITTVSGDSTIKRFRTDLPDLLQNVVATFNLDFGKIYGLERKGNFKPYHSTIKYGNFQIRKNLFEFRNQFHSVINNAEPKSMNNSSESNLIAFPLYQSNIPLGVMVLGGRKNGSSHSFKGMPSNIIENLIAIISRGLFREKLSTSQQIYSKHSLNELLFEIYGHDSSTVIHCNNTSENSEKVAENFCLPTQSIQTIKWAAFLHDIGKIFIPPEILYKPGFLSPEEWKIMKLHSEIGSQIVYLMTGLQPVSEIVATHHEHYDGSGYPFGLSGENIPFTSRILAVADSFEAMTESRVYQTIKSKEEAKRELIDFSGTQFDPNVVKVFLEIV